jgi:GNAT superfamily N-acetyltransferase
LLFAPRLGPSLYGTSREMLEEYRGQGYATRCVAYMIQHLRPVRPVWEPEETNLTSLRLTAMLGCVPLNELPAFRALLR